MPGAAYIYEESMNESELTFLMEKEVKDKRVFQRVLRTLLILSVIPGCLGIIMESIKRSKDTAEMSQWREQEDPHVYLYYFFGMFLLLFLVLVGGLIAYRRTVRRLQRDIRSGKKTIENTVISRKQFVSSNNTCHFFLKSARKLSIEVSKEDFELYEEGDEINIEYSTYSGNYFGYF